MDLKDSLTNSPTDISAPSQQDCLKESLDSKILISLHREILPLRNAVTKNPILY